MLRAKDVIEILDLKPLVGEGGFFRQNFKSDEEIFFESRKAKKPLYTSIYFLITRKSFSKLHMLSSDEVFHHYLGDSCLQLQLYEDGKSDLIRIGKDILNGERPQIMVKRGVIQGTMLDNEGKYGWALLGTSMGPGFTEDDFKVLDRDDLLKKYPDRKELIEILSKDANYDI